MIQNLTDRFIFADMSALISQYKSSLDGMQVGAHRGTLLDIQIFRVILNQRFDVFVNIGDCLFAFLQRFEEIIGEDAMPFFWRR